MAKYEKLVMVEFKELHDNMKKIIEDSSYSSSFEDETIVDDKIALMVFERYSYFGGNRLTMSILLVDIGSDITKVVMITSGGSEGIFMKINTLGEKNFLKDVTELFESVYKGKIIN